MMKAPMPGETSGNLLNRAKQFFRNYDLQTGMVQIDPQQSARISHRQQQSEANHYSRVQNKPEDAFVRQRSASRQSSQRRMSGILRTKSIESNCSLRKKSISRSPEQSPKMASTLRFKDRQTSERYIDTMKRSQIELQGRRSPQRRSPTRSSYSPMRLK